MINNSSNLRNKIAVKWDMKSLLVKKIKILWPFLGIGRLLNLLPVLFIVLHQTENTAARLCNKCTLDIPILSHYVYVLNFGRSSTLAHTMVANLGGCKSLILISGGSKGAHVPPPGSKFFQFHAVCVKFWQNRMLAPPLPPMEGWCPHLREILDPPLYLLT